MLALKSRFFLKKSPPQLVNTFLAPSCTFSCISSGALDSVSAISGTTAYALLQSIPHVMSFSYKYGGIKFGPFFLNYGQISSAAIPYIKITSVRIRDILVRIQIRIRILGSVPLTNSPGVRLRILLFASENFKTLTKNNYFSLSFYAHSFLNHLHHSSKIKKSQNSRNQGFS